LNRFREFLQLERELLLQDDSTRHLVGRLLDRPSLLVYDIREVVAEQAFNLDRVQSGSSSSATRPVDCRQSCGSTTARDCNTVPTIALAGWL